MTVKDLIELLSKENNEGEVLITVNGRQLYVPSAPFRFNVRGTEFILLSKWSEEK